jgi:sugar O-acyltransferase (sialic acid O-acetyltransferase NeuD family)
MATKYVLYGASGHAKVVFEIAQALNINIDAILDDKFEDFNSFFKKEILNPKSFDFKDCKTLISIGNNEVRQILSNKINQDFFSLVHPKAIVSESSKIGDGTVVMAGVIINADSTIGKHCIINTGAIVEHDCVIEDFAHISPNASLAGNVKIGEGTQIGIGAQVIQGVKIGKWSIIGAGTVIIKDVPDFATVVGNPGKVIKINA